MFDFDSFFIIFYIFFCLSEITFENNDHLKKKLANKALPNIEYVNIPINNKECKYQLKPLPHTWT